MALAVVTIANDSRSIHVSIEFSIDRTQKFIVQNTEKLKTRVSKRKISYLPTTVRFNSKV